jgi:hypothetical protein
MKVAIYTSSNKFIDSVNSAFAKLVNLINFVLSLHHRVPRRRGLVVMGFFFHSEEATPPRFHPGAKHPCQVQELAGEAQKT